jgi:hypothetical protein
MSRTDAAESFIFQHAHKVHTNTSLAGAFNKLAGNPFTSFILDSLEDSDDFQTLVKYKEVGT